MEETPLKTLTLEEETVVKKLAEIHSAISDGRIELSKVTASLETAYNDRRALEDMAIAELYQDSQEILNKTKNNYDEVIAYNAQAQQTFQTIKKLAETVQSATQVFEMKHEKLLEQYRNHHNENASIKQKLDSEKKQIEERKRGLDKFYEHLLTMASQVDSRIEALKLIKK